MRKKGFASIAGLLTGLIFIVSLSACGGGDSDNPLPAGNEPPPPNNGTPPNPVYSATHYVSATVQNGSGDGSETNPWSWDDMVSNLMAGMVVEVGPGVYTKPSTNQRLLPAFDINNKQGTAQARIILYARHRASTTARNQPNLRTVFETTGADQTGTTGSVVLSITDSSHVTLDGFYVDTRNAPLRFDTGAIRIWGRGSGNKVLYNHVIGASNTWAAQDNYVGIRHEGWNVNDNLDNSEIAFNLIELQPGYTDGGQGFGGIECYSGTNLNIHHNEVHTTWGIQIKNNYSLDKYVEAPASIHHNFVKTEYKSIWLFGPVSENDGVDFIDVYQNVVIADARWPLMFEPTTFGGALSDTPATEYIRVVNNTFYGPNAQNNEGVVYGTGSASYTNVMQNNLFQNNIIIGGDDDTLYLFYTAAMDANQNNWANNNYFGFNTNNFANVSSSSWSFSQWQASQETTATNHDPMFNDVGNDNLTLNLASDSISAGVDVLNLLGNGVNGTINQGAYILSDQSDIVGIE